MTKKIIGAGLLALGLTALLLGGCSQPAAGGDKGETLKIGVAVYRSDDAFISSLYEAMEALVPKKEAATGTKILLGIADGRNSQRVQNENVESFLARDYDAICVNMVDRTMSSLIVDKAQEKETPVVFFNREPVQEDMNKWTETYYIGADARECGAMQGEIVAELYRKDAGRLDRNGDGKIQYVVIEGDQGHQDTLIRTEYSVKSIVAAGIDLDRLAISTANWLRSPAYGVMEGWIAEYGGEIELVICNNDEMAIGAIEALEAAGIDPATDGPVVVGVDGTAAGLKKVVDGTMAGTVYNDATGQAEAILDVAIAAARGEDPAKLRPEMKERDERVPYEKITLENVQFYLK